MDISSAVKTMADVTAMIKHLREEADRAGEQVFARISAVAEEPISLPRNPKKPQNRANVDASSAQEFYRRTVFIPFLDSVISELKHRFDKKPDSLIFQEFLPKHPKSESADRIVKTAKEFSDDLDEGVVLRAELVRWFRSCLLYTSPSPRDLSTSRMPSSA